MNKLFFLFFFTTIFMVICKPEISSQQSNEVWLGLSSDISSQPVSQVTVIPSVMYFPITRLGVGCSGFYRDNGQVTTSGLEFRVRAYATANVFGSGGFTTDFNGTNGYILEVGYTSFFGRRFYMEPSVRYVTIDKTNQLSLLVGVGVKL